MKIYTIMEHSIDYDHASGDYHIDSGCIKAYTTLDAADAWLIDKPTCIQNRVKGIYYKLTSE